MKSLLPESNRSVYHRQLRVVGCTANRESVARHKLQSATFILLFPRVEAGALNPWCPKPCLLSNFKEQVSKQLSVGLYVVS